jgi:hypothetical protein
MTLHSLIFAGVGGGGGETATISLPLRKFDSCHSDHREESKLNFNNLLSMSKIRN